MVGACVTEERAELLVIVRPPLLLNIVALFVDVFIFCGGDEEVRKKIFFLFFGGDLFFLSFSVADLFLLTVCSKGKKHLLCVFRVFGQRSINQSINTFHERAQHVHVDQQWDDRPGQTLSEPLPSKKRIAA
jgi:hypothetical protein